MALKNCVAKLTCLVGLALCSAAAANGQVVISQIYGGGGNGGALYRNDFIELHNNGMAAVSLNGWSVQYASTTGTNWTVTNLSGSIAPGGYYLIQQAQGAGGSLDLPTPQAIGTIAMAAGAGKVALASTTTALSGACPTTNVVDLVAFGTGSSNCSGAGTTATLSATTAALRGDGGCTTSGNNATDFSVAAPAPRNVDTPPHLCGGSTPPSGVGASNPADACPGQNVVLTITVTQGLPASTITSVVGDLSQLGWGPGETFFNDGTNGDAVAGDNVWSLATTNFSSVIGARAVPVVITDALGRTGSASVVVNVPNCNLTGFLSATPVCSGGETLVTFSVTPGQSPPSTGITATADLSSIGGSSTQQLFDDGTHGDVTAADNTFSYNFAPQNLLPGAYTITASATDSSFRSVNRTTTLYADDCINASSTLVISQIYGGGGNSGATYTHDFVELFNRGTAPVSLAGKTIQYASGENDASGLGVGTDRMHTLPNVTLQPGQYFLVREAAGTGGTQALPTPDHSGNIAMSATRGTVALVDGTSALGLNSCSSPLILDLIGYGNGAAPADHAFCKEGVFYGPTTANATGLKRNLNGCMDTNNNGMNWTEGAPAPRNSTSPFNICAGGPPPCGTSDFNGDGDYGTDADIEAFFACLAGNCCDTCYEGGSDFNADGDYGTDADIESFFRVLAGGSC